jgi:predicted RNase H-like HicB family nuclease
VEELPGANTQGDTLEEARANRLAAVALLLRRTEKPPNASLPGARSSSRSTSVREAR